VEVLEVAEVQTVKDLLIHIQVIQEDPAVAEEVMSLLKLKEQVHKVHQVVEQVMETQVV
tara:strand:+ start:107 stop:283 length:177 start_codon:yes stop_codon:yes gene_type:complete